MSKNTNLRLRVEFRETGRLAMLSHLELARALERAVRRADLPYAVSQGFSPHMKIAFGAALPVGVGGLHEYFDLQTTEYMAPEAIIEALQKASVPDLYPISCEYITNKVAAASVGFPFCTYQAQLSCEIDELKVPESITVVRKKKEKTLVLADFLVGPIVCEGSMVTFTLESKPTGSLRPDVLMQHALQLTNEGRDVRGEERVVLQSMLRIDQRETAPLQ